MAKRKSLLAKFVLNNVKISETERAALVSGASWWDEEIYRGAPRWKKLKELSSIGLTPKEQAFLDGPVNELCAMIDEWAITSGEDRDVPPHVRDFMNKNLFLGMEIPEEFGGLGFSATAHALILQKICSRGFAAATNIMVPNSLGPAKLIVEYGTDEQKKELLPKLARGELLPCFALTEPYAGSDATNIQTRGVVVKGKDGEPVIKIDNIDKRYSTLAPIADLIGLAVKVEDPDNLLGRGTNPGITVALVPRETPGLDIGRRHSPLGVPFQNGPIRGSITIGVDKVVGGINGVGNDKGWSMLVEQLAIGRGISLPAVSAAGTKMSAYIAGAYSRVRRQFGYSIGQIEGVQEELATIAGLAYITNASSLATVRMIDAGHKPAIPGAIMKYKATGYLSKSVRSGVQALGGKAVMEGPNNFFSAMYHGLPIAETVEGHNIMTRGLIAFGQAVFRSHPYILKMVEAAENGENWKLRKLTAQFAGNFVLNIFRTMGFGGTTKQFLGIGPYKNKETAKFYRQTNRLCAAFNVATNLTLALYGPKLKSEQFVSGRMADISANLYLLTTTLNHFEESGRPKEDLPMVRWASHFLLNEVTNTFDELLNNYPNKKMGSALQTGMMKVAAKFMRALIMPQMRRITPPSDALKQEVAQLIYNPGPARDRLTSGIYIPPVGTPNEPLAKLADAYNKVIAAEPIEKKIRRAIKEKKLAKDIPMAELTATAEWRGVITADEAAVLADAEAASAEVIKVDDFAPFGKSGYKPKPV